MLKPNRFLSSFIFAFGVIFKITALLATLVLLVYLGLLTYSWGKLAGFNQATQTFQQQLETATSLTGSAPAHSQAEPTLAPSPRPPSQKSAGFSGPQLWEAVNKSRVENGVNPLNQLDVFCTIASIRLNQQLAAGTLDNHAGFESTLDQVSQSKTHNVAEYLVYTTGTASEAVNLWLNTLGHRTLLTGGEYVYGCTYAQNGYGVAIVGY